MEVVEVEMDSFCSYFSCGSSCISSCIRLANCSIPVSAVLLGADGQLRNPSVWLQTDWVNTASIGTVSTVHIACSHNTRHVTKQYLVVEKVMLVLVENVGKVVAVGVAVVLIAAPAATAAAVIAITAGALVVVVVVVVVMVVVAVVVIVVAIVVVVVVVAAAAAAAAEKRI